MRICYDSEVDALSITFGDATVTTQELAEGITAEYDARGRLAGLEILDAAKRLDDPSPTQQIILEKVGPTSPEILPLLFHVIRNPFWKN